MGTVWSIQQSLQHVITTKHRKVALQYSGKIQQITDCPMDHDPSRPKGQRLKMKATSFYPFQILMYSTTVQ